MEVMLSGKTIAITRSELDSQEFVDIMQKNNAKPISLPTIELIGKGNKIVDAFLDSIKENDPDYSVFMSSKAVKLLFDTARKTSKYQELQLAVANTIVISVGPKTKTALENEGIRTSYMPDRYSSVGVGEVLSRLNAEGKKVIVPRSGASTPFLKELLEKMGIITIEIYLYDVKASSNIEAWKDFVDLFSENKIDGLIFTSVSSVKAFFEIMSRYYKIENLLANLNKTQVVAIGPFTADELKKQRVQNKISEVHTISGACDTIKNIFSVA